MLSADRFSSCSQCMKRRSVAKLIEEESNWKSHDQTEYGNSLIVRGPAEEDSVFRSMIIWHVDR